MQRVLRRSFFVSPRARCPLRGLSSNPEKGNRPLLAEHEAPQPNSSLELTLTGLQEQTFVAIKPDGVQRRLVGTMLSRFEARGFKMTGLKIINPTQRIARAHYAEHAGRDFYDRACRFLCSGPVVASVWQGRGVVKTVRAMAGVTNPLEAAPGTIRGDFGVHFRRNLVHSSDSIESASREIDLWFEPQELVSWDDSHSNWIYELPNAPITFDDCDDLDEHPGHLAGKSGHVNEDLAFRT